MCAAPKGNQFWKVRSSHGRKPIFESPDQLWDAACEYFEWIDANPLQAAELVKYQGSYKTAKLNKMRAMTVTGLCTFLDISVNCWYEYSEREDFKEITTRITEIIKDQKFQGAAAEMLNPNIIARDLGLADKSDNKSSVTVEVVKFSDTD